MKWTIARPRIGWRVPAAWLTLCIVWSSTWLAIKFGLRDLPPVSYAAIRFVIVSHCGFIAAGICADVTLARL